MLKCLLSLPIEALQTRSPDMINAALAKVYGWHGLANQILPLTFDSVRVYKDTYTPLIVLDTWASCVESFNTDPGRQLITLKRSEDKSSTFRRWTLWARVPTKVYHKTRDAYYIDNHLCLLKMGKNLNLLGFIEEIKGFDKSQGFDGDKLPLIEANSNSNNGDDIEIVGDEVVRKSTAYTFIRMMMRVLDDPQLDDNTRSIVHVQPLCYLKPTMRLIETLSTLGQLSTREKFFEALLEPRLSLCRVEASKLATVQGSKLGKRFNEQQRKAILGALAMLNMDFQQPKVLLIQGPPGTGKTSTLIGLVQAIYDNLYEAGKPLRLLVCAPSNGAVDEIGRRLVALSRASGSSSNNKSTKTLSIVRVGQLSQVHPDMARYHLDNLATGMNSKADNARRGAQPAVAEHVLMSADIILSTLASCQKPALDIFRQQSSDTSIRAVIVDEAAQCCEPELLMPLVYPVNKMILIGDPIQLPATVISRQAATMGYGRSLFERFYRYFQEHGSPMPMVTLESQFRMHPEIVTFPSNEFYFGRLKTGDEVGRNRLIPLKPYLVFDVNNTSEAFGGNQLGLSKTNAKEVEFICTLLDTIIGCLPRSSLSLGQINIGVITFYRGQKKMLTDELGKRYRSRREVKIEVNTVDGFQGRQRDVIVLSSVRAHQAGDNNNFGGGIGFLKHFQRLNVALTRAKSALYICLQAKTVARDTHWKRLIENARQRGHFRSVQSTLKAQDLRQLVHVPQK